MFFVVLALSHLALNEPRRVIVHVCAVAAIAVPGIIAATGDTEWGWQYWMMGFAFGWGFGELGYRFRLARDELARRPCPGRRPGGARRAAAHRPGSSTTCSGTR